MNFSLCILLFLTSAYPWPNLQDETARIKKIAEELNAAVLTGNSATVAALTYPKAVAMLGGREKMMKQMEQEMKAAKADGFELVSATVKNIAAITKIGTQRFTVVNYTLKMKVPNGYLTRESFLIGVAALKKNNWTFVDGTAVSDADLKTIFPQAIGRLQLPTRKPPEFNQTIQ